MGQLRIMDQSGDVKTIWDKDNAIEVKAAQDQFEKLVQKGYIAYEVKRSGGKGRIVDEFDPDAEKYILAPPIAGG